MRGPAPYGIVVSLRRHIGLHDIPGSGTTLAQKLASTYDIEVLDDLPTGKRASIDATDKVIAEIRKDLGAKCYVEHRVL